MRQEVEEKTLLISVRTDGDAAPTGSQSWPLRRPGDTTRAQKQEFRDSIPALLVFCHGPCYGHSLGKKAGCKYKIAGKLLCFAVRQTGFKSKETSLPSTSQAIYSQALFLPLPSLLSLQASGQCSSTVWGDGPGVLDLIYNPLQNDAIVKCNKNESPKQ